MAWHHSSIIRCEWKKTPDGYRCWVQDDAQVFGAGADIAEARGALIDAILDAAPDLDRVIPVVPEFIPPIPAPHSVSRYLDPELHVIFGDSIFETMNRGDEGRRRVEAAYSGGVCPQCHHGLGARTTARLIAEHASTADAGFLRGYGFPPPLILSGNFISQLTIEERSLLEVRPIDVRKRTHGREYFELIARPVSPFVGLKGIDSDGVECGECGWRSFRIIDPAISDDLGPMVKFVVRESLPDPLPSLSVFGSSNGWCLCVTGDRLRGLLAQKAAKGLVSERLGVVPRVDADVHPRLARRGRRADCPTCSRWPEPIDAARRPRRGYWGEELVWSRENWTWIELAIAQREILLSRMTMPVSEIVNTMTSARTNTPAIVSWRCPACWRLGHVSRTRTTLSFDW